MLAACLLAVLALTAAATKAAEQPFGEWVEGVKQEALAAGIRAETVDRAMAGIKPQEKVVELDRKQPERRLTFVEYRDRVLSAARVAQGKRLLQEHGALLAEVEAHYGVPARVIVALWGIESSYGQFKGRFSVIEALVSLAYDGRRAEFFRKELLAALTILDRGDITLDGMYGSWAGAMGQSQFMPSTYLGYAVDFDGDGRRDIWTNHSDIFASMANYLSQSGWQKGYRWGRPVEIGGSIETQATGLDHTKELQDWHQLGVRRSGGGALPVADVDASLLVMDEGSGPAYLVYDNFRVLMIWNRSSYFATTVGLLSDEFWRA